MHYRLPLIFEPQPEGGFTVRSPALPEFLTEGDSIEDAVDQARDALAAVLELYRDLGKPLPPGLTLDTVNQPVQMDLVIATP